MVWHEARHLDRLGQHGESEQGSNTRSAPESNTGSHRVQGRRAAAERSLQRLLPAADAAAASDAIAAEVRASHASGSFSVLQLLADPLARAELHVGVMLQLLQQLCGINTVMYFTPVILQMAGFVDRRQALLWACLPAACNAIGSVASALLPFLRLCSVRAVICESCDL